jgi:hypothetical protein
VTVILFPYLAGCGRVSSGLARSAISYFWPYLMGSEHGVQPAPYQSDKALAETGDPVLNLALMVYRRD